MVGATLTPSKVPRSVKVVLSHLYRIVRMPDKLMGVATRRNLTITRVKKNFEKKYKIMDSSGSFIYCAQVADLRGMVNGRILGFFSHFAKVTLVHYNGRTMSTEFSTDSIKPYRYVLFPKFPKIGESSYDDDLRSLS
ncbi:uncharacterized protein LOC107268565 [Cephus cinctus]|uniref:Uncharacterized protein LOC107268565 n=1 Tax=Cephus cinctus TaxID=211228 RepID=A0AAJ7BXV3_CEPCN|nr:uncharacterized protein LOC107268565 [Cephus cinctus]